MRSKIDQARHDVESAERAMEEEIESAQANYHNAVTNFCEAVQPTEEEAKQVGYDDEAQLADAVNHEEEEVEELVENLDKILTIREVAKAAGA
jgi:hypothetical protein